MTDIRTQDLADEVGVHVQRVYQWGKEGLDDAAKLRRGYYDRQRALEWIEARRLANTRETTPDLELTPADVIKARVRRDNAASEGAELRNAILRGEMVSRRKVDELLSTLGVRLLMPLDEWTRAGGSAHQVATNQKLANELRREWVGILKSLQRDLDAGEDLSATRIRIPRRMGG